MKNKDYEYQRATAASAFGFTHN